MDLEKKHRLCVISALQKDFVCYEEVELLHAKFGNQRLRADVVAFAKSGNRTLSLAIEVKSPNAKWELKNWISLIVQASDYVDSSVIDSKVSPEYLGQRIHCACIFPSPNLAPWTSTDQQNARMFREWDLEQISGALLLAQHFKVGRLELDDHNLRRMRLRLGTDTIWLENEGFRPKAFKIPFLRRIGSRKINLLDVGDM